MGRIGGDDRLVGPQEGGDGQKVCLGAAGEKVDVRLRSGADPADGLPGVVAHGVQGVAAGLLQIGVHQALEDFGVGALAVVVAEAVHGMVPHFQNSKSNKNSCRNVTELMLKLYRISCIKARREPPFSF